MAPSSQKTSARHETACNSSILLDDRSASPAMVPMTVRVKNPSLCLSVSFIMSSLREMMS